MANERSRPLILIADDDRDLRSLLVEQLESGPWDLMTAGDGEQALLLALEHVPDLLILDVMMPRFSGWEVCREVRRRPELAGVGVIMLTAIGQTLNELTSPLYGADDQLDKPFRLEDLEERIRRVLAARAHQAP
ncbi:MAG: response regulator [Myxococcota bacterium]|jgi:DNA-binding response OmpR family regulator|nr:response regulator [Myxococcota bacterium]